MKRCPDCDRLAAYLADQLDPSVCEALEEHVEGCAACQGLLDELTERWDWGLARRSEADAGVTGEQTIFLRRLQQAPPGIMEPVAERGDPDGTARGGADLRGTIPGSPAASGAPAERAAPAVPNYEVLGELGRGGMGVVYRARQVRLNRPCALKMILAGAHATPEAIARFLAEAQAIARLQHPHIVQIHHIGEADGLPFFELEYMPGGGLDRQLDGTAWPPQRAARLVEQLAGAMAEAHRLGVVHRDLKPANVLLAADGTPKITDFGLAKMLDSESALTRTDLVMGSPNYIAPEQAGGKTRQVGPAADIYALGAILYKLLTGRPPFRAATALETLDQVKGREPVPPSRLVPKLARDIETICLRCLHKEPTRRYADASALAEDLRRFLANEPIRARQVSATERSWRWCQRNPVVAGLMAAVFVLLATVAGVASVGYVQTKRALNGESEQRALAEEAEAKAKGEANRARTAEQEVRRQWYAASINLMQLAWDTGQVGRLHALLAETEAYPERGFEWYYWQRLCHLEQYTLIGHRDVVNSVSWSPDGTRLATGSRDGTAKVWDAASGRERLTLRGHAGPVFSVSWSPDGRRLAAGTGDGMATMWEAAGGRELITLNGHTGLVGSVSWSPEGTRLATASEDGTAKVWDAAGRRELFTLKGPAGGPVSWSPDGTRLATGSGDSTAKVWDAAGGRELLTLKGHAGPVWSVSWSPDGRRLATGSRDGTAKVWDAASSRVLLTLTGHTNAVNSVPWSRDGTRLATGSWDGTAKVWDTASGRELLTLRGHTSWVNSVSWSPDGTRLATGSDDGTAKVWDAAGGGESLTLRGHSGVVGSVSWSPERTRLATGSVDGTAKVWDAAGGCELFTLKGHAGAVGPVSWSPDGTRLATGGADCTAKVWDAAGRCELFTLKGHTSVVLSVSWSPDGTRLATGSWDNTAKVWDAAGRCELFTLKGHTSVVNSVPWSPDGTRLATGSNDGTAKVWDAAAGRELFTLEVSTGSIRSVSWSPDGTRLATGSDDGTAKVWDAAAGRELLTLKGHTSEVLSVSWSPDGTRLATGSADGTAKVWDAVGGRELLTLKGHTGLVWSVSWSLDGTRLATGSDDGTAKMWDAAGAEAVQDWARQERAVQDHLDRNDFRGPQSQGFLQTWLLLLPLPFASGETGAQALDRPQLSGEAQVQPRPGERVLVGGRPSLWQEYRSPKAVVNFNAMLGRVAERSVAYAVCYLESDQARDGLWLQVGSDDLAKVFLNGREIYRYRLSRALRTVDTVGPVGLKRGINVLLFKVVNEAQDWQCCARLVDDAGRPAQGLRVKLTP